MCKFHTEQKSVTSHVKLVKQPMQASTFLHMIEIDLMDFRKCPCECIESHMWAMNITDHHTKHVSLYPLTAKSGEKVLQALQEYCFTYGYPRNILCDSGKEFCNKNIDTFCLNNGITIKHGAPRTPQTQGLIERSNRSCKEDMHTCIVSTAGKNVSNWCKYLGEVCYTHNISYHSATKTTPYEAVFGMKPHREVSTPATQQVISDENYDQLEDADAHLEESTSEIIEVEDNNETFTEERQRKRIKISENQTKYNKKMVQQSEKKSAKKCNQFTVGDQN